MNLLIGILLGLLWPLWSWFRSTAPPPQVDLGYEVHEALFYNEVTKRYTFRNIRYAQAPVGDLRYAYPTAPTGVNPVVQRGNESRICALEEIPTQDSTESEDGLAPSTVTEDCLFLDVVVPRCIFERQNRSPAAVYVHYEISDDDDSLAVDKETFLTDGLDGALVVGVNFRKGRLAKPASPRSNTADLGEADRDLALKWVREHIHRFGGDPKLLHTVKGSWQGKKN